LSPLQPHTSKAISTAVKFHKSGCPTCGTISRRLLVDHWKGGRPLEVVGPLMAALLRRDGLAAYRDHDVYLQGRGMT
jgi:hypothetical protein